jgi:ATP synthase protein I
VPSVDSLVLRRAGILTMAVGLVVTVIGAIVAGSEGLIAGILGTFIVICFFSIGQLIVGSVIRNNPEMAMTVALTTYLVKIGVLLLLLLTLQNMTFFNPKVFAVTIVACTIAWTIAEVWVFSSTKVLYVEPERQP